MWYRLKFWYSLPFMARKRANGTYIHCYFKSSLPWGSTYSKIITKRAFFTALICQIVNQLAIFTIFASQDFLYKCQRIVLLHGVKRVTLSSKTGVSIVTAPCFLKTLVMVEKTCSRIAISLSLWSLVP